MVDHARSEVMLPPAVHIKNYKMPHVINICIFKIEGLLSPMFEFNFCTFGPNFSPFHQIGYLIFIYYILQFLIFEP